MCFAAALKEPFFILQVIIYIYILRIYAVIKMPRAHFSVQFLSSTFKVLKNLQSGAVAAVLVVLRKVMLTCAVLY